MAPWKIFVLIITFPNEEQINIPHNISNYIVTMYKNISDVEEETLNGST